MKVLGVVVLIALMSAGSFAADTGVEIQIIDNKVSMHAKAVPLGRLLQLLDRATGMTSRVKPELANRPVSVQFSGLSFDEAVQKIFEGQKLDYFVLARGIVVTSPSVALGSVGSASPFSSLAQPVVQDRFSEQPQPFMPPQPQQLPNGAGQPAVVQTPFGPIANPNFQGGQDGNVPNNAPMNVPGQQAPVQNNNNPFGGTLPTYNQNPQPTAPTPLSPAMPTST
jgi:hypothetical protein